MRQEDINDLRDKHPSVEYQSQLLDRKRTDCNICGGMLDGKKGRWISCAECRAKREAK